MADPFVQLPQLQRELRKINRLIAGLEEQIDHEEQLRHCLSAYQQMRDRIQARIDYATMLLTT